MEDVRTSFVRVGWKMRTGTRRRVGQCLFPASTPVFARQSGRAPASLQPACGMYRSEAPPYRLDWYRLGPCRRRSGLTTIPVDMFESCAACANSSETTVRRDPRRFASGPGPCSRTPGLTTNPDDSAGVQRQRRTVIVPGSSRLQRVNRDADTRQKRVFTGLEPACARKPGCSSASLQPACGTYRSETPATSPCCPYRVPAAPHPA
jgi:hypothetical protein